jgi:hypothetical protein
MTTAVRTSNPTRNELAKNCKEKVVERKERKGCGKKGRLEDFCPLACIKRK